MKILLYCLNYAPEFVSTGKYNTELAGFLAALGHEVQVITSTPYYPYWKAPAGYRAWKYQTEIINKVKVTHCPLFIPHNPTGLKRILHLLSFALTSFFPLLKKLRWHSDLIIFISPSLFTFPGALLYSKLTKAKTYLHFQDLEIDAAFNLQLCRFKFLKQFLFKFELYTLKRCNIISCISQKMREKIAAKGIDKNKIFYLPNWVDTEVIKPVIATDYRAKLNVGVDKIVCLYSGTFNAKTELKIILDAAVKLKNDPNYLFLLCGEGVNKTALQNYANNFELPNIIWRSFAEPKHFNELLSCADIHLLPQNQAIADEVLPSKLSTMLASGRPIIATTHANTEIANIVSECGLIVPPNDSAQFAAAIKTLGTNSNFRHELGIKARKFAENNFAQKSVLASLKILLSSN